MCFYGIIYLKIGGGRKRKIFVLAPHSSIPVRREVGRQAGYCSLRELFILLGGRRQKRL